MDALVVGAGSMGRWLGEVLRDGHPEVDLAFLDRDEETASSAARDFDARTISPDTDERFDLVAIAVPIPATPTAIARYAPRADSAVIDVGGTMSKPVAALEETLDELAWASFHPLFAPENEPGNVAVVYGERDEPADSHEETPIESIVRTLEARENHVFETAPEEHDRAMRTVQAGAHTAVLAYALAADSVAPEFHTPISSELEALVEQVTSGEAAVYSNIQAAFDGASDLAEATAQLAAADSDEFEALFDRAGRRE